MAKPRSKPNTTRVAGKVASLNISPKGRIDGALITTPEGVVQLNLPKHGPPGASRFEVGTRIDTAARLDHDEDGDHPVYEVIEDPGAVDGVVARLNYARHGEVNGYHVEDGTFVHVKPDGAARYKIKVADRIRFEGPTHRGEDALVVAATSVAKVSGKRPAPARPRRSQGPARPVKVG